MRDGMALTDGHDRPRGVLDSATDARRFWIGVASRDHVNVGVKGGFIQLNHGKQAPLRRNVTIDEVGNVAAFLCSDLASGITGEVVYVDAGFSTTAFGSFE